MISYNHVSSLEYCISISRLHIHSIKHGFLPLLGYKLLAHIYLGIATHNSSKLIVALDESSVVGFIGITSNTSILYREIFIIFLRRLISRDIFYINFIGLSHKILSHIFSSAFFFNKATNFVDLTKKITSELLAIAVHDKYQGMKIGTNLIDLAEDYLLSLGCREYMVRTNELELASNSFYQKHYFTAYGKQQFHSLILNIYCKSLFDS